MSKGVLLWVGVLSTLLGVVTANPFAIIPGMLTLVILGAARIWTSGFLTNSLVTSFRLDQEAGQYGDVINGALVVQNDQPFPVFWLECSMDWPGQLNLLRAPLVPSYLPSRRTLTYVLSLRWFERVVKRVQISCHDRGPFTLGPLEATFSDPFGLSTVTRNTGDRHQLLVYPRLVPVSIANSSTMSPFGNKASTSWIFDDPLCFRGIRKYTPQDPFTRVEWNATARTGELQVRVTDASFASEVAVFVDVTSAEKPWQGVRSDWVERTLVIAASVLREVFKTGRRFGVYSNGVVEGCPGLPSVAMGAGPRHFAACMALLARLLVLPGSLSAFAFNRFCSRLDHADIVVITAICSADLLRQIDRQRSRGRRVSIVFTCPEGTPPGSNATVFSVREKESWDELQTVTLSPVRG